MKKIFLLSFLSVCFCFAGMAQTNLVTNPDMETWTSGKNYPDGYGVASTQTETEGFFLSSDAHSGTNSLNVKFYSIPTGSYRFYSPKITGLQSGTYTVSVWVKGKGVLRWISLTKQTSDGKAGAASGTNSDINYVISPQPWGGTGAANVKDLTEWTEIKVSFTIKAGFEGDYNLHFSINNTKESEGKPLLFDDISLVYTPLTQIRVSDEVATTVSNIPGFQSDEFNYIIPVSFDYNRTPVIDVLPTTLAPVYTQAGSLSGVTEKTASILVNNGTLSASYSVKFEKQAEFIDGCPIAPSGGSSYKYAGTGTISNLYVDASGNRGEFLGGRGLRNNSTNNGHYETPQLANGAGTLTFYVKQYETPNPDSTAYLNVFVKTSTIPYASTPIFQVSSDTLTDSWAQVIVPINNPDPTTQVKIVTDRTFRTDGVSGPRYFYFDDIKVTTKTGTSIPSKTLQKQANVYADQRSIVMYAESKANYQIYSINGILLYVGDFVGEKIIDINNSGLYIVKLNGKITKLVVR